MDALSTANRTQVQFLYTTHNTLFLRDSLFLFSHVKCIVLLFLWICIMRNSTIWGPNSKHENATKFYWNTVLASKKIGIKQKVFVFLFEQVEESQPEKCARFQAFLSLALMLFLVDDSKRSVDELCSYHTLMWWWIALALQVWSASDSCQLRVGKQDLSFSHAAWKGTEACLPAHGTYIHSSGQ